MMMSDPVTLTGWIRVASIPVLDVTIAPAAFSQ